MSEPRAKGMSAATKTWLTIVLILILVIVVQYVSNRWTASGAERRLEEAQTSLAVQAHGVLVEQAHEMLRLSAVPLSWAVRSEMMRDNTTQIDDYLQRFVKEPNINRIALVVDGNIQIATDKKLEAQSASGVFPVEALEVDEATVVDSDSGEIFLAVPVVGLDERLGTLILVYSRASIDSHLP